jgi:hypothetical protein
VRQRIRPPAAPADAAAPSSDEGTESQLNQDDRRSYEVGYGKPPVATRFKPGQSGNPRGRPKAAKGLKTMVRETLTQKVAVRTGAGEKKMSRMEAVLHKTIELAMKGNARALLQLTSLYASAVPEAALMAATSIAPDELTATDLAILEELKATFLAEAGESR